VGSYGRLHPALALLEDRPGLIGAVSSGGVAPPEMAPLVPAPVEFRIEQPHQGNEVAPVRVKGGGSPLARSSCGNGNRRHARSWRHRAAQWRDHPQDRAYDGSLRSRRDVPMWWRVDVHDRAAVRTLLEQIVARAGPPRLWLVVVTSTVRQRLGVSCWSSSP
jgi:hypothetical protein